VDFDDGLGEVFADFESAAVVHCPYCGEPVELLVDLGGGVYQDYVEDCEVCCRPWRVRLILGDDGGLTADVGTLDDV
jgi:hypothetical protein